VEARDRVRIEYHAASTGETSRRTIDPEQVFLDAGNWYVAAWDLDRDAERLFRVDRVADVERMGERFSERGLAGAGRALYTPGVDDVEVRLRLAPAARWVAEYYELAAAEQDGDALVVTFPAGRLEWVERLLLRLGTDVEVLAPPELRDRVRALAEAALARYRGPR
ncbi:MAG: helix-turn-helix transcriptional regulator, partial [Actinomycetota bacterium]